MNNAKTTAASLSLASTEALRKIVAVGGATVHPQTRNALSTRNLVRMPFWNQPNYCRATMHGKDVEYQVRKAR